MIDKYKLVEEYLEVWPLERVRVMSLQEYTNLNRHDSFCYWLEKITESLGSIWGGSGFKFGIYKQKNKKAFNSRGRLSDESYAWYSKYGSNRDEVFEKVRAIIIDIIEAAQNQNYKHIDTIDLGDSVKWKIAFLYSNYTILNSFRKDNLFKIMEKLGDSQPRNTSFGELQHMILSRKPVDQDYFEYGEQMWNLSLEAEVSYWLYAPGENASMLREFYKEEIIALGWDKLEDLNEYESKEAIRRALQEFYSSETSKKNDTLANIEFRDEIKEGDIIIAKKGIHELVGYGVVTSDYYFDEERNSYKHCRKVDWKKIGSWVTPDNVNLALKTLTDVTKYKNPLNNKENYGEYLIQLIEENPSVINLIIDEEMSRLNHKLDLLKYKKQIILQGPPGTGKTRLAKLLASQLLKTSVDKLANNNSFGIIQFHPSYSYEDFVRGIVAKPDETGSGILYEAENKLLAEFAESALKNYLDSKKDSTEYAQEEFLLKYFDKFIESIETKIEETGEAYELTDKWGIGAIDSDAFRYGNIKENSSQLRMHFKDIIQAYNDENTTRQDVRHNKNLSGLAQRHASYTVRILNDFQEFLKANKLEFKQVVNIQTKKPELKNFVLIIDEINRANLSSVLGELIYALEYRGEAVESMYKVGESNKIILPPNLYIIGTMNTADRSVGHIDYAIRRRFAFVDVLPKDISEQEDIVFDKELFENVKGLFTTDDYVTSSEYLSLEFYPKDVALGHSYFIDRSSDGGNMETRLKYEIKPILMEYVKDGVLIGENIIEKISALETSI